MSNKIFMFASVFILLSVVTVSAQTAGLPVSAQALLKDKYLVRSGVAFDAKENIFGLIRLQGPKNFFRPDTKQVSWWGEFKPFKTWGTPELEARWYNPQGELISKQSFKGQVCQLAKTTLKMEGLQVQGMWKVEIYYKGGLLDQKQFSIFDPASQLPSTPKTATVTSPVTSPTVSVEMEYQNQEVTL